MIKSIRYAHSYDYVEHNGVRHRVDRPEIRLYIKQTSTYTNCINPSLERKNWTRDQFLEERIILDSLSKITHNGTKELKLKGLTRKLQPYRHTLQSAYVAGRLGYYFENQFNNEDFPFKESKSYVRLNNLFAKKFRSLFRQGKKRFSSNVIEDPVLFLHMLRGSLKFLNPSEDDDLIMHDLSAYLDELVVFLDQMNKYQSELKLSNVQNSFWNWLYGDLRNKYKNSIPPERYSSLKIELFACSGSLYDHESKKMIKKFSKDYFNDD